MGEEKSVQAVDRALDVIESVASEQNGRSLTEISRYTGMHKSTVYRLLITLMRRGYLVRDNVGQYRIGHKMIEVTSYYISGLELQTEARPYIAEISSYLGMGTYLGVLEGDKVVYVEKINGTNSVRMFSQIGIKIPAYCSALGKCLLSNFSNEDLEKTLEDCSFIKFTPNTISCLEDLKKELMMVRKRGWAMDDEEYEPGHRCVGVPIYDYKGDIIAAVSVCSDVHVLTDDRVNETALYMMGKAREISERMGNSRI